MSFVGLESLEDKVDRWSQNRTKMSQNGARKHQSRKEAKVASYALRQAPIRALST